MNKCAVVICSNRRYTSLQVTFHRFPSSETLRKSWVLCCGVDYENFDFERERICSTHFKADDFERGILKGELFVFPQKRRLKPEAVPSVNIIKIKQETIVIDDFEIEEEPETQAASIASPPDVDKIKLDSTNCDSTAEYASANTSEAPVEPIVQRPVLLLPKPVNPSSTSQARSSLPATQTWEGPYKFKIFFASQPKNTKGVTWTYSSLKNKLYVGKDVSCPVNFSADEIPGNVKIRVVAHYGTPEHASEIVQRCINHSKEELEKKIFEAEHLVRCESRMATYEVDQTTLRHSVVVPFEIPPVGQNFSTYIYKFTCFGSCAGGPNRRPIMLIFSLEKDGEVVGRRRLDVKICACPGRDRRAEEEQLQEKPLSKKRKECDMNILSETLNFTKNIMLPSMKKKKVSSNGTYIVKADDKEQYDFLMQMKTFYQMFKTMRTIPQESLEALAAQVRRKSEQDGYSS